VSRFKVFICLLPSMILLGCSGHGTMLKFNGGELYYTSAVSKEQADKLGNFLVKGKFFDGNRKTVQLTKSGDTYQFRMVLKKDVDLNDRVINPLKQLAQELSRDIFDSSPVEIHLCDEHLKTIRVIN
jgi:hypothetical protein